MKRNFIFIALVCILAFFNIQTLQAYWCLSNQVNQYQEDAANNYDFLLHSVNDNKTKITDLNNEVKQNQNKIIKIVNRNEEIDEHTQEMEEQLSYLGVAYYYINQDYEIVLEKKQEADRLSAGEAIAAYADQFVGCPYVWGGNSLTNGCDCSHFIWLVLRDTIGFAGGYSNSGDVWLSRGTPVASLAEAQAGDIIIYPGHYAIYDGKGYIIEARSPSAGITHDIRADWTTIVGIRRFV